MKNTMKNYHGFNNVPIKERREVSMATQNEKASDRIAGQSVTIGPSCPVCRSTHTRHGPGIGPHYARLSCASCGAFIKWLPKPTPMPSTMGDGNASFDPVI
jgi:hypothetical protein